MGKRTLDSMTATNKAPKPAEAEPEVQEATGWRPTYNTEANFDPGELSTSYLSVAQALSPDVRGGKVREGQLVVTGMAPVDKAILVIAGHTPKRQFTEQGQQRSRCWSPDAKLGIGDPGTMTTVQVEAAAPDTYLLGPDGLYHLKCAECPFSKWTDSGKTDPATGRTINNPPPCQEVDSFLCYSVTHGMPVLWNLKGTSAQAARFIKTLATGLGFGNFAIEVTTESRTNKANQSWKVPKVVLANEGFAPEELAAYAAMARGTQQTAGAIVAGA